MITVFNLNTEPFPPPGTKWTLLHPKMTMEHLGYIPGFLQESDERPAREQINERYKFGGWQPYSGFTKLTAKNALTHPGDPALIPIAMTRLRDERIFVYQSAWVAIVQPDRTFEVARLD